MSCWELARHFNKKNNDLNRFYVKIRELLWYSATDPIRTIKTIVTRKVICHISLLEWSKSKITDIIKFKYWKKTSFLARPKGSSPGGLEPPTFRLTAELRHGDMLKDYSNKKIRLKNWCVRKIFDSHFSVFVFLKEFCSMSGGFFSILWMCLKLKRNSNLLLQNSSNRYCKYRFSKLLKFVCSCNEAISLL